MLVKDRPRDEPLYDWAMAIAAVWLSGGMFVDSWYHLHSTIETFFEPAHGFLYAGLLLAFGATGLLAWINLRRGHRWPHLLPRGYVVTLIGMVVFALGGFLDLVKHQLWGFEESINALLSPTHLLIGIGFILIAGGVICAHYGRAGDKTSLFEQLPMLLCAA